MKTAVGIFYTTASRCSMINGTRQQTPLLKRVNKGSRNLYIDVSDNDVQYIEYVPPKPFPSLQRAAVFGIYDENCVIYLVAGFRD